MNRISRELEIEIIVLWLEGHVRDDIAKTLGVSGSTVTEVTSALPESLARLRELNQYFRKIGLSALALRMLLEKIQQEVAEGLNPEELPRFVEYAVKTATDANYELRAVVAAAERVAQLEEQSGMPYPQAIKEYETKTRQNNRLTAENEEKQRENQNLDLRNSELHRECVKARREHRKMLRQAHVTEKEISISKETQRQLQKLNIDFGDVRKLSRCVSFIKESGGNPEVFFTMVDKYDSAKEALGVVKNDLHERQSELELTVNHVNNTRFAAEREHDRMLRNKAAADAWPNRVNYLRQIASSWETHLERVRADTGRQLCFHDAIIEQNVRNLRLNPENAAHYRLQKAAELRFQEFEENIKAHAVEMLERFSSSLTDPSKTTSKVGSYDDNATLEHT